VLNILVKMVSLYLEWLQNFDVSNWLFFAHPVQCGIEIKFYIVVCVVKEGILCHTIIHVLP